MVILTAKTLALVISAIKELREMKGSTSREILNYITSTYSVPLETARRQVRRSYINELYYPNNVYLKTLIINYTIDMVTLNESAFKLFVTILRYYEEQFYIFL